MRDMVRFAFVVPTAEARVGTDILSPWSLGAPESDTFPPGDAARGAYLARASGCVSCHTNAAAQRPALAEVEPLDTPFGTFVPPNITPHSDAGIWSWTIQDFAKAVRQGISPDGAPCYPVFTYLFYAGFTDQDIADLWEAFRTVPPVEETAQAHDLGLPFSFRSGPKLWRAAYLDAPNSDVLIDTSSPWNRGRVLVEGAAHFSACHSGRTPFGGLDDGDRFAGNVSLPGGRKAPSILAADLVAGGWTVANLAYSLKSGVLPNGDAFGDCKAEVVAEGTSFLTDADRTAIATYPLDPEGTGALPSPSPTAAPSAVVDHSNMDMTNEN
ncbi:MAG: cytochrome C [Pseudomonadota bacterium]